MYHKFACAPPPPLAPSTKLARAPMAASTGGGLSRLRGGVTGGRGATWPRFVLLLLRCFFFFPFGVLLASIGTTRAPVLFFPVAAPNSNGGAPPFPPPPLANGPASIRNRSSSLSHGSDDDGCSCDDGRRRIWSGLELTVGWK